MNNYHKAQSYKAMADLTDGVSRFLEGALDPEINSTIQVRGLLGGVCMAIPFWGLETIIYAIVLWGTYVKISKISGVPFRSNIVTNVIGGFIVNIAVNAVLSFALDFIPVLGWIGAFIIGYLSILISGGSYVKMLKVIHKEKCKSNFNLDKGLEKLNGQQYLN